MTVRVSVRRGFTLAEMLVVLSIMIVVAGIAVPIFLSSRTTTRRSDAENTIRAALSAAREAAIERRTVVAVEFMSYSEGHAMVLVDKSKTGPASGDRRIGPPLMLPEFIEFDFVNSTITNGWDNDPFDKYDTSTWLAGSAPPYPDIAYLPDGSVDDPALNTDIVIIDTTETNALGFSVRNVLRVLPATGLVVEAYHYEDPGDTSTIRAKGWL